jgi:anhydro-N-acetylmuramic acid kinase
MAKRIFTALGLMSGTSMDGIDLALLVTNGRGVSQVLATDHAPWDDELRALVRRAMAAATRMDWRSRRERPGVLAEAEEAVTGAHVMAVRRFLKTTGMRPDVIGFHGQTVVHRPEARLTVQLGDGQRLADALGIPVVWDMRAADVAAGGQGAPLAPAYHAALAEKFGILPVAFVNIGGVSNVTWVGRRGRLLAFDCGPGNAPIDDWVRRMTGASCDVDGRLAARGRVHEERVRGVLVHPFFRQPPPKSLDRGAFTEAVAEGLSAADGAATLTAITARAIALAGEWMPEMPEYWIVCGGGRRNRALMGMLAEAVREGVVVPVESYGENGDMIEAACWGYLAVRSLLGLPLSWPETTGVPRPLSGGVLARPRFC